MFVALAMFVSLLAISAGLVAFGCTTTWRFAPSADRPDVAHRLVPWAVKGLAVPVALWTVMNVGISERLQAFMPQVQAAQNSGAAWLIPFAAVIAIGLWAVSSNWCAVTLGWAILQAWPRATGETRDQFRGLCLTSLVGMLLPAILVLWLGGWMALGLAIVVWLAPIAGYAPAMLRPMPAPPMYARAVAKMKFGKYPEAEWAILQELEKCEDDFDGWLMLADLYANHFHDLAEAEQTILEICDQPRTTPSQLAVALHRLADWHLNLATDPDAARRALRVIGQRLPGTHLARMAELRASQLPATTEELRERRQAPTVALPALSDTLDDAAAQAGGAPAPAGAASLARKLAERLARDPADSVTRERYARVLAEQQGQVASAIEQVETLLALTGQPAEKYAEWLSLTAAWTLRYQQDVEAGKKILERVIREFPVTPQAASARRRLAQIELEQKQRQSQQAAPPPPRIRITPDPPAPPTHSSTPPGIV